MIWVIIANVLGSGGRVLYTVHLCLDIRRRDFIIANPFIDQSSGWIFLQLGAVLQNYWAQHSVM